ncbi:MAG: DNA mismatch repair endonuclease MutL, partial [Pyrinomonadaceae bacterium]
MSKIRVLSDHVANQIAAGEVVERPASVAKELVENAIDAGARHITVDVEAGGRRLLRVGDDGEGMTHDDALLAFERHATSKIGAFEDLDRIQTLGFRGEALPSIASVARVELVTHVEGEAEGTRVLIEGGRMRDVSPAARPRGTTIAVRELFFNTPARRKFLRSEATESYHLTNLVTHYALAHPEIAFVLTNNGREALRCAPAANLRERAYQIFGADFIENLLEVGGGHDLVAHVRGYVSAPRERRTTRDAQYMFVNGRIVRDRLVARALSEGYRTVLPHGTYPAALLFLDVPPEEVDVNVHPAKTEVRFRRAAAVADAVRDAVRDALAGGGFLRARQDVDDLAADAPAAGKDDGGGGGDASSAVMPDAANEPPRQTGETRRHDEARVFSQPEQNVRGVEARGAVLKSELEQPRQERIEFAPSSPSPAESMSHVREILSKDLPASEASEHHARSGPPDKELATIPERDGVSIPERDGVSFPPVNSAAGIVRGVAVEALSEGVRPLGQLEDSYIIATDPDGLLLVDQHAAHERVLYDSYLQLEDARSAASQNLLVPETFDLTPAQVNAFDAVAEELEHYGFGLMRLSGRTVAVRAVPADLPAEEARNLLAEVLDAGGAVRR